MTQTVGRWTEYIKSTKLPIGDKITKKAIRESARAHYPVQDGDHCFVCRDDRAEVLRKHHLLPVGKFSHRPDINNHLLCLCECCHTLAHALVYGDRGGISWSTVVKLKEAGYWSKFVEIDRMAVAAAKGEKSEYTMRMRY